MTPVTASGLLTAEQFRALPDRGTARELVRGEVVEMNLPVPRHGLVCSNVAWELNGFVKPRELGRVITNDSGILTQREPDTVRGAAVAYYSYQRLPRGPLPDRYLEVVPEVVFEVRSRTERWQRLLAKASEYLDAGVLAVCVLDEQTETLTIYRADELQRTLAAADEFTLPDVFGPELRIAVSRFFVE